jgi:hypothetical protein
MRLVSYGALDHERAGILQDGGILDLEDAMRASRSTQPVSDIRLFLEQPSRTVASPRLAPGRWWMQRTFASARRCRCLAS